MILTKELTWKPDSQQMLWAKTMIAVLNNHGVMFTPEGCYQINHNNKTLTLTVKSPMFSAIKHAKIARTFELLGWTVLDGTGVKSA